MARENRSIALVELVLTSNADDCIVWPMANDPYPIMTMAGRQRRVNRVVCERAHGPAPTSDHQAAHECGNKDCYNWRHLSWKTPVENMADKLTHGTAAKGERHGMARLTADQVAEIRRLRSEGWTFRKLGERFGVWPRTAQRVTAGLTWR